MEWRGTTLTVNACVCGWAGLARAGCDARWTYSPERYGEGRIAKGRRGRYGAGEERREGLPDAGGTGRARAAMTTGVEV